MAQFPLPETMRRALDLARIAAEWGEVPVGAVIVKDGAIIAEGHNRPRESHDTTAHADIVATRMPAAKPGNEALDTRDIYAKSRSASGRESVGKYGTHPGWAG